MDVLQEVIIWFIPVVGLIYLGLCLLKYVWEQWHNGAQPEVEEVYGYGSPCPVQHYEVGGCRGGGLSMQARQRRSRTGVTRESPSQIQDNWLDEYRIDDLGKKLTDAFKDQSKPADDDPTQKEFAVLYLSSSKKDLLEPNFTRKSPEVNKVCDNSKKIFPLTNELCNYVTARPHDRIHAEKLIMGELHKLMEAYKSDHEPIRYIVLYTWLFPCKGCASAFASKMQHFFPFIYVLYSIVRPVEGKDQKKTERKLKTLKRLRLQCVNP